LSIVVYGFLAVGVGARFDPAWRTRILSGRILDVSRRHGRSADRRRRGHHRGRATTRSEWVSAKAPA